MQFGAASDMIVEATLVTAQGAVVTANSSLNPDLLWALQVCSAAATASLPHS